MNRFECMTDEEFDHAIGMHQAALARREAEARGWKRLCFDLIRAAGGTQRISMSTVLKAHTEDVIEVHEDLPTGDLVYRVYRAATDSTSEHGK